MARDYPLGERPAITWWCAGPSRRRRPPRPALRRGDANHGTGTRPGIPRLTKRAGPKTGPLPLVGDAASVLAAVAIPAVATLVAVEEITVIGAAVPVAVVVTGEPAVIPAPAVAMIVARTIPISTAMLALEAGMVPGAASVLTARMSSPSMVAARALVTSSTSTAAAGEGGIRNSEDHQPSQEQPGERALQHEFSSSFRDSARGSGLPEQAASGCPVLTTSIERGNVSTYR